METVMWLIGAAVTTVIVFAVAAVVILGPKLREASSRADELERARARAKAYGLDTTETDEALRQLGRKVE